MNIDRTLVYVKWRDACHEMQPFDIDGLGPLAELHEVGWLIKETKESITLCLEAQEEMTQARLWLTIPQSGVVEIRRASLDQAFPPPPPSEPKKRSKRPVKKVSAAVPLVSLSTGIQNVDADTKPDS